MKTKPFFLFFLFNIIFIYSNSQCIQNQNIESFETGFGTWQQDPFDDSDWSLNQGSTPSINTGPSAAFDGISYIFFESSSPLVQGDVANLIIDCIDLSILINSNFVFAYHMYGASMGTLNIDISTDFGLTWNNVWTKSGDQGNQWNEATIDLSSYLSQISIRIQAIRGSSYTSDIGIDLTRLLSYGSPLFVDTLPQNKNVLLEQFTGYYAYFDPDGHVKADQVKANNPNDVFLVRIHTGGYSNPVSSSDPNFQSPFGAHIAGISGLAGYPAGTINRRNFQNIGISPQGSPGTTALSRSDWQQATNEVLAEISPVNIGAQASYDFSTGVLTVNTETYYTSTVTNTQKLNVAVLQNNLPGPQSGAQNYNPADIIPGSWSPTYNHRDVLRHLMEGQNGLNLNNTTSGTFIPNTHTWNVSSDLSGSGLIGGYFPFIDPTNLEVIAFITEGDHNVYTAFETPVNVVFSNDYDVNLTHVIADDVICSSQNDLKIIFRNYGNITLNSCDFNYSINGTSHVYNWTGNLSPGAEDTILLTNVLFTPQSSNTIICTANNPNGQTDQNLTNNSDSTIFLHEYQSGNVLQGISPGNISVDITTDGYGSETTWEIVGEDGTIYGSGGPYASSTTLPTVNVSIPPGICAEFILYDSYGDGMCCANGVGSVLVQDANGLIIFNPSSSELTNFTKISAYFSSGFSFYGCTDTTALNYDPLATVDDGSCFYPVNYCNSNSIFGIPTTDIKIGETTYDLQSNASVDNRLIRHSDGTISATWTMSAQFTPAYSDRGTGYNYFDGTSWDTSPTSRIESSRTGWPSILTTGSGKEIVISHNTDYAYLQMSHRPSKGIGSWTEQIISSMNSNGVYTDIIWNRAVIGGSNNETIHMVGVIAPSALGGTIWNGLDGALVYYRSQDGGDTWDIQDMQLPTLDTSKYLGFDGDNYAIAAQGETVVVAYFGGWDDSVILKSTDNGNTWNETVFLDFPVDKYVNDSGLDLDGDGVMDTLYTTDKYGSLLLDNNGIAHVFFGNMRVLDADLSDGNTSYFGGTSGLMYWNESMGPDDASNSTISSSLWYSSLPQMIASAQDLDGDGMLNYVGIPTYYSSLTSMPSSGIDTAGNLYVTYSSLMENVDNGSQNFRHINLITSIDGGNNWSCPIDLTNWNDWGGAQECVFARMERNVDDKIRLIYQKDFEPGLAVRGDEDIIDMNDIQYLECNVFDIFKEGCTDPSADNYDSTALYDDGSCLYCNLSSQIVVTNPSDSSTCDGVIIINSTSPYPITYSISDFQGNLLSSNNFAFGLCNGVYFISVIDSSGCSFLDTLALGIVGGCLDSNALNYNSYATYDDGSCIYPTILGCTDSNAYNYDPQANTDDGSCLYCDLTNSFFITQNTPGLCDGFIVAITNSSNLPISYLWNTGSTQNNILNLCDGIYSVTITDNVGCTINDTVVIGTIFGCTDPLALNYDPYANSDDGSCIICDLSNSMIVSQNTPGNCDGYAIANSSSSYGPISYLWSTGSTQNNITNLCSGTYTVTISDNVGCVIEDTVYIGIITGCTDPNAINYNPNATVDDGSCTYCVYGCTDPLALNYDPNATCDDGSCSYSSNCTSPKPTGLYAYDVIDTRAKIGWDNMNDPNCMVWKYFVRYREVGTSQWTTKSAGVGNGLCNFGLNTVTKQLLNLTPSTSYEFRMKAFYCGGTSSNYSTPVQFTTADPCPDMTNLTATTFNGNQAKVRFDWDTTGSYTFARILLRVDTAGSVWQTAGGFGVYYPTLFVNKFGLTPGESYRAQGRTFCDSNITAYRSLTWTAPIFWTQPGSIREGGGLSINNLDIYPNPSRNVFNITFNSDEKQNLRIRILSVVGAEVYREDKENFIGEYTKQVSLDNYGKGIYFLEIETNTGIINKKLILQ